MCLAFVPRLLLDRELAHASNQAVFLARELFEHARVVDNIFVFGLGHLDFRSILAGDGDTQIPEVGDAKLEGLEGLLGGHRRLRQVGEVEAEGALEWVEVIGERILFLVLLPLLSGEPRLLSLEAFFFLLLLAGDLRLPQILVFFF